MSSATEERRKIEEEIRQKQNRLKELDRINGKTTVSKNETSVSKFALWAFIANIMITIVAICAWSSFDSINSSGMSKTIMMAILIFSFICLLIDAFVVFNKYKNFSSFFTGFVIVINLPAFILAFVFVIYLGLTDL